MAMTFFIMAINNSGSCKSFKKKFWLIDALTVWDNLHLVKIRYRAKTTSSAIVCAATLAAYMYVICSTSHCRYVRYHFLTWNPTNVTVWPWLTIKFHFHFTTLPFRDDTISRKAIKKWKGYKILWVDWETHLLKWKLKYLTFFFCIHSASWS